MILYDTVGDDRFESLTMVGAKDAHCIIFCFDLTKPTSLINLLKWKQIIDKVMPSRMVSSESKLPTDEVYLTGMVRDDKKDHPCVYAVFGTKFDLCLPELLNAKEEDYLPNVWNTRSIAQSKRKINLPMTRDIQQCIYLNTKQKWHEAQPQTSLIIGSIYEPFLQGVNLTEMNTLKLFYCHSKSDDAGKRQNNIDSIQAIQKIANGILLLESDFPIVPFTSATTAYNIVESFELLLRHLYQRHTYSSHDSFKTKKKIIELTTTPTQKNEPCC